MNVDSDLVTNKIHNPYQNEKIECALTKFIVIDS